MKCLGMLWRPLLHSCCHTCWEGEIPPSLPLWSRPGERCCWNVLLTKLAKSFLSMKIELFVCSLLNSVSVGQTCSCDKLAQVPDVPRMFRDVISLYLGKSVDLPAAMVWALFQLCPSFSLWILGTGECAEVSVEQDIVSTVFSCRWLTRTNLCTEIQGMAPGGSFVLYM